MERNFRRVILTLLVGLLTCASVAQAEYAVSIGIKQTDGRWQDTLLAGESCVLTIEIINEGPIPSYSIPLNFTPEAFGAFATPDTLGLTYVGRMATSPPFTIRSANWLRVDGVAPDSVLYGAVEFGTNYLPAGSGVVIEQVIDVSPYVGTVRIDTAFYPPAGFYGFSDTLGTDIEGVNFYPANAVFPVVLRNPNGGPSCTPPADVNSPFGSTLHASVSGSDPESDPLVFKQVSGPGTTSGAGAWSWTPGCADVGTYEVCVTVSDPNHLDWDTCCFQVTVTQTAPSLNCEDQTIHYGQTLSYFVDGVDDDCPSPLTYTKLSGPGSLNPSTGEYTYLPSCADVGLHFVEIRATDGQDTVTCTFNVTVTNSPPTISCPANFSAGIGDPIDFLIGANDPDGDALTFTLLGFVKISGPTVGGPNNAPSLSPDGQFFWQTTDINDDDFGIWEVSLRVDEDCDSAFCTFQIEVTPNRPPVCDGPSDRMIKWGESVNAQFNFSDPDGDSISFQQISGPGTMDATGLWSWTPGCGDVGTYEICAMVADSAFPGGDTCCFVLTVYQLPPNLPCRDTTIHAGSGNLVMDFGTTDDGCPGGPVQYSQIFGKGSIDPTTGIYTLSNEGCKDIGDYSVTIVASDGVLADTCDFTVHITNQAPTFACPDDTLDHTNDRDFTYDLDAVDPDGDAILSLAIQSFTKLSGPAGGPNHAPTISPAGVVTWSTDSTNTNDLGLWRLVIRAEDSCDFATCTLYIEVFPNRPPTCVTADVSGHVGEPITRAVFGDDPDGDLVIYKQIAGPGSISVVDSNALWSWTPTCEERGEYDVCVTVSDSVFTDADTCCFHVTIYENAPVVQCSTQTVHYGETLIYDIASEDDGCPAAGEWSLISGPGSIDPVSGQYTLPTVCGDVGTIAVTVALDDTQRADTCTFDVNITNMTPYVTCPDDLTGLKVGATVDLDIDFGDDDGDPTTISLVGFQKLGGVNANPPNNTPTLDAGGHFHWATDYNNVNDVATWAVTVRVNEPCDSSECTFQIEILANEAPVCSSPNDTDAVCTTMLNIPFGAADAEGDSISYNLVSGPGSLNTATGMWSWATPCDSGGFWEICVSVSDFLHPDADTCCFTLALCSVPVVGDVNGDGAASSEDIIIMVNFIFKSGEMPFGPYTADMNCDGLPNAQDILELVDYVFKSGDPPCNTCDSPLFP